MKKIAELNLGFSDAENYKRKENKELFNTIFVKNIFLEKLLQPSIFFLLGEKGTGKTAYSVFLSNNDYKNTISELKYIRETDYQKFVTLKKEKHLQLSDYDSIWKVIILLLIAKSLKPAELDHNPFSKKGKIKALMRAVDAYYHDAFAPEIIYALNWLENSKEAAELVFKYLKLGGEETTEKSFHESKFQVNLLYIQDQFEKAIRAIRISQNHILFIDGIDIRPGSIPYKDYLECIKGLANAIWSLNNDFFANIKGSTGRFRVVLLLRPDIFNSIGLQNQTNKIRDNSVLLDWRTTYPEYRTSFIFEVSDNLLRAQQDKVLTLGVAWDCYFPWKSRATSPERAADPSFYKFLKSSYSRPRDMVTMMSLLQEETSRKGESSDVFSEKAFDGHDFQNRYSEYLMGGIRDQLSFYYSNEDYEQFLRFFTFLGQGEFDYSTYKNAYDKFIEYLLENNENRSDIPEFVETPGTFLQFLYDTNILCFIETVNDKPFFRWCYRERSISNICPKVKSGVRYSVHYGLMKALNLGFRTNEKK